MKLLPILAASALVAAAAPAFAADAPAAKPKPPAATNSFGFEAGAEYTTSTGAYADFYIKPSIAHTFADGIIWGGSFQQTWKKDGVNQQEAVETTLGYNYKIDSTFTVTSSAGLGYLWDSSPSSPSYGSFGYYVLNAGLNAKLAPQLTWTVISGRWRDAFIGGWQTPKLSTTLSYAWTPASSIYASYGYGWKNGATDKWSGSVGLKIAF